MLKKNLKKLADDLLAGDRRSLAKLITVVEDGLGDHIDVLEYLYPKTGNCYKIGITGPPGAGKSTLVDQLIVFIRKELKQKVGVIAVDPSSPFTGGALLGDRIRMQKHYSDEGVYIRSLSSRGYRGGISLSTKLLTKLYDAYGFDFVIVETVGVGQSEVDIMELADTTCVVLVPESGDTVQTMKAGLLEIADIFVVNKSDREGAKAIAQELRQMVNLEGKENSNWSSPVTLTNAKDAEGIQELFSLISSHRKVSKNSSEFDGKRAVLLKKEVLEIATSLIKKRVDGVIESEGYIKKGAIKKDENPFSLAVKLLDKILKVKDK